MKRWCSNCKKISKIRIRGNKIYCEECDNLIYAKKDDDPIDCGVESMIMINYHKLCAGEELVEPQTSVIDDKRTKNIKTARKKAQIMYDEWGDSLLSEKYREILTTNC